jgi:hypothetical protein
MLLVFYLYAFTDYYTDGREVFTVFSKGQQAANKLPPLVFRLHLINIQLYSCSTIHK